MTTQSPFSAASAEINAETKRCVRDFVRAAILHLSQTPTKHMQNGDASSRWEQGPDGHFRERAQHSRRLTTVLDSEWLSSQSEYSACVARLKADPLVARHVDRLVGTDSSKFRIDTETILRSMIHASLDDEENITFSDDRFNREWAAFSEFLCAEQVAIKTVAPLPNLLVPVFPLRLNDELVLDRLAEDEVTRCCQVGVLRPPFPQFPLIEAATAVGIRRIKLVPKRIEGNEESPCNEHPSPLPEGSFGRRPAIRGDLVVGDVLSALRIFKHSRITTMGCASWTDSFWLSGGTTFRIEGQWPFPGKYELSSQEVGPFLELWQLLEEAVVKLDFSIHRFNLAFDRGLLADRIVDLVIAAESLFLGELDVPDRGELRFRFALRAAKYIEHPNYGEHDIYRLMRQAYDARSAVVHGGSPDNTKLPNNPSADFCTFIDTIEELVRRGLCKALAMKEEGRKLRQADYWLSLLLVNPVP